MNHAGITLVALVVTIIVLLILAGVSLNLVSGSDGILGRASSAADKNNVAKAGEEVELLMSELQSEYFEKVYVNGDKTVTEHSADEYVIAHLDGETTASGYTVDVDGLNISIKNGSDVIGTNEFESNTSATLKKGWTGDKKGKTSGGGGNSTPTATTYSVTYNANAGSDTVTGMPEGQTKTQGEALTLSSSTPTRAGYAFQGWATTSSGSVAYSAGGSYTTDAELSLHAVWEPLEIDLLKYSFGSTHFYNADGGNDCKLSFEQNLNSNIIWNAYRNVSGGSQGRFEYVESALIDFSKYDNFEYTVTFSGNAQGNSCALYISAFETEAAIDPYANSGKSGLFGGWYDRKSNHEVIDISSVNGSGYLIVGAKSSSYNSFNCTWNINQLKLY